MDNVNIETTLNYNEKLEKKLIEKMDNITFEFSSLSAEGKTLLQILNYSPKIKKPNREALKNLKKIEMPQLSELGKLDFSKLDIIPKKRNKNKAIQLMIKSLLLSIIDDIFKKISKEKYKEELNEIIEDKKIKNNIINHDLKIKENFFHELKVFLFNKDDFILINIAPDDTVKMIKNRIINKIIAEKEYELKFPSEENYDLRIIKIVNDKFVIDSHPIGDVKIIYDNNIKNIAFSETKIYKVKSSKI